MVKKLKVNILREDNDTYTGVFEELDLMANAPNKELLKTTLAKELLEYSEEYLKEYDFYYNSANRKKHCNYVNIIRIKNGDIKEIKKLIEFEE